MKWQSELRKTMIFTCEISENLDVKYDIIPVVINRKFQPAVAPRITSEQIRKKVEHLSSELNCFDIEILLIRVYRSCKEREKYQSVCYVLSFCN
jgi:hypothetical protein